jgi:hypothetical protein
LSASCATPATCGDCLNSWEPPKAVSRSQSALYRRHPRQAARRSGGPEESRRHRGPQRLRASALVEAARVATVGCRTKIGQHERKAMRTTSPSGCGIGKGAARGEAVRRLLVGGGIVGDLRLEGRASRRSRRPPPTSGAVGVDAV